MYHVLLALHSLVRWFVLVGLLYTIFRACKGWYSGKTFSKFDNALRHWTATLAHIQLVIGIWLYFVSPIINYFMHHYKEAVHQREVRFFGMEHNLIMLMAIILITVGSAKAKRAQTDKQKYKTMAIWYTIALIIILTSIPWKFSPIASRPYFRSF